MKKLVFGFIAAALLLAGCASNPPTVIPAESLSSTPAASAPATATEDATTPSESATVPGQAKFGDTVKFDSGVAITVSKGTVFKPSATAMRWDGTKIKGTPMFFTITVKNGSAEPVKGMSITASATSGTSEAEFILDEPYEAASFATIMPGKTIVYKTAYDVANPKDVTIDMSPDFINHAYFTS